jgi:Leucine-rich repeat (LRR) protein
MLRKSVWLILVSAVMLISGLPALATQRFALDEIARERIAIAAMTGATTLDLSWLHLDVLPPEIGDLAGLRTLILSENQLTSLSPEIGDLAGLRTLSVSENELVQIPLPVVMLPALRYVAYDGNPLAHPPQSVQRQGWFAVRDYLRQPEPHVVRGTFWLTVIAFLVTSIVATWTLARTWLYLQDRPQRLT